MNATVAPTFLGSIKIFGRQPKVHDLLAASPLIIWSAVCLVWQWGDFVSDISKFSLSGIEPLAAVDFLSRLTRFLFAALLIALLLVRRTPIKRQQSITRRAVAFFGCYVGIAAQIFPVSTTVPWIAVASACLVIFGMSFSTYSLWWLGRSFSIMPESRKLVTTGPYSIIRHPLYVGEQVAVLGIALQARSTWVLAVLVLQFCCQYYRLIYEEEILTNTFPEYEAYAKDTARLIPWLY
jgi:protein-S-isoprenylcysteine O-methyltransferase Ste14